MRYFIFCAMTFMVHLSFSQTATLIPDFIEKPVVRWEYSANASFYASPVVQENFVYIGGLDSILHALDITNGTEKWSFKTNGEIRSNVCIQSDTLYLNGGDGIIYCLNIHSGKLIWKFRTKGEQKYDFADYFQSTPVIFNNVLFCGSGDQNLYAINARNGQSIWTYATDGMVHSTPVIDHDKIFFGSFDGYVYALDISTGQLIWKFKTVGHRYFPKGEVQGSPTAFDHKVYIGARDYNLYVLDQEKGFCHWNKAFSNGWALCNSVKDSILYIGTADERKLLSVHPTTGTENWNEKMDFLIFGNNAYTDNMLLVGTTIGKLHGYNLKDGKKVWSFETESYRKNRSKYFKNDDTYRDDIYSIILSNEHFLEVECELGGIFSQPCISNDLILVSSTNGKIYCLGKR